MNSRGGALAPQPWGGGLTTMSLSFLALLSSPAGRGVHVVRDGAIHAAPQCEGQTGMQLGI